MSAQPTFTSFLDTHIDSPQESSQSSTSEDSTLISNLSNTYENVLPMSKKTLTGLSQLLHSSIQPPPTPKKDYRTWSSLQSQKRSSWKPSSTPTPCATGSHKPSQLPTTDGNTLSNPTPPILDPSLTYLYRSYLGQRELLERQLKDLELWWSGVRDLDLARRSGLGLSDVMCTGADKKTSPVGTPWQTTL